MQVVIPLSSFASANGSGLVSRFTEVMVPLLTAQGPGAVSRFSIGPTIAAGLSIGTLFTLFVQPACYLLLAKDHQRAAIASEKEQAPGLPSSTHFCWVLPEQSAFE